MRLFLYVLLFFVGFILLDSLDRWGQRELQKQEYAKAHKSLPKGNL